MTPVLISLGGTKVITTMPVATGFLAAAIDLADPATPILWTAGVLAALSIIWKALHAGEIIKGTRNFLRSWNGQPAAPGCAAVPGLPTTVAYLGLQLHEIKGRDEQLASALEELGQWSKSSSAMLDRVDERVGVLDRRISSYRRRSEEQNENLRTELERRTGDLHSELILREQQVNTRLSTISQDLLRAETMRAALAELGINVEPPTP